MANQIEYGLKFSQDELKQLLKIAEKLDKTMKDANKSLTEQAKVEGKKQVEQFKHDRRIELEIFKNTNKQKIADEKAMLNSIANERKKMQNGKFDMFAPVNMARRVAGYIGISTAVYGSISAIKDGVRSLMDYEKAMSSVYATIGNVTEADKLLLNSMAKSQHSIMQYGLSAKETADAMRVLAQAGLDASGVLVTLEPALALSTAGDIDLAEATDKLIKVLNGFGLAMNNAGQIADYFAYSAAKSPTSVKGIADAMAVAAPSAKVFGQSVESAFAVVSAMSFAQLEGAKAGNAYDRMLKRLTKSQSEVREGLAKYNIKIFLDKNGEATAKQTTKLRDFADIMKDIQQSGLMKNFADAQAIFGNYAFKNAAQFGAVVDKVATFKKDISESTGAVQKMADVKLDNAAGEWKKIVAQWEALWTNADGLGGALKDVLHSLNELLITGNNLAKSGLFEGFKSFKYMPGLISGVMYAGRKMNESRRAKEQANIAVGLLPDNPEIGGGVNIAAPTTNEEAEYAKNRLRVRGEMLKLSDKALDERIALYGKQIAGLDAQAYISKKEGTYEEIANEIEQKTRIFKYYLSIAQATKKGRGERKPEEIIEVPPKVGGGAGSGAGNKQKIDDLSDFLRALDKLRNTYSEKELTDLKRTQREISNTYAEREAQLRDRIKTNNENNVKTLNEELALTKIGLEKKQALENAFNNQKKKIDDERYKKQLELYKQRLKAEEEAAFNSNIKRNEDSNRHYEEISSIYESALERYGSVKQRQRLLDEEYLKNYNAIEEESALRNMSATQTEELITNLKKEHAEARIQIAYEAWQKEHQFASATMGAIGSAYDTFSQSLTDIDMNGKDRREAIWESFRSSAITAIMDVLKQKIIAWGLEMAFDETKKAAEGTASAAAIGVTATAAAAGTAPMAAYAAATNSAALATSLLTGGATAVSATAALAGLTTATAAYMAVLAGGGALTAGFGVADAIVADGVVHPYRKDDLVMIGTGLGSKSGAQIPNQALPEGSGGNSSNAALLRELQSLRFAVSSGNAAITKAVADNTPTFSGEVLSPVQVYKRTLIGKNQANFVVNNNA